MIARVMERGNTEWLRSRFARTARSTILTTSTYCCSEAISWLCLTSALPPPAEIRPSRHRAESTFSVTVLRSVGSRKLSMTRMVGHMGFLRAGRSGESRADLGEQTRLRRAQEEVVARHGTHGPAGTGLRF